MAKLSLHSSKPRRKILDHVFVRSTDPYDNYMNEEISFKSIMIPDPNNKEVMMRKTWVVEHQVNLQYPTMK